MFRENERRAYDYNMRSDYVDSCVFCPILSYILVPYCACAPSVLQWKQHVRNVYSADDDDTLKDHTPI